MAADGDLHERDWLERARAGDEGAFAVLVERYQRPVFTLCYRMLGDAGEAEDASQETFLKAYCNLRRYDMQRKFATWLLSIAANGCVDRLRRRRLRLIPLSQATPRDPDPGPEALVVAQERERALRRALDQLGGRDRAALILRYWHELSYGEIAEVLNTSVSSVKSRLHRAKKALARLYAVAAEKGRLAESPNGSPAS
jgi:RNA polymerase sigma-70 factor (ECF subfamily)